MVSRALCLSLFVHVLISTCLFQALGTESQADAACRANRPPFSTRKHVSLRVASFNVAMSRPIEGQLLIETRTTNVDQIRQIAAIIQLIDADIILLNEVDYDPTQELYKNFRVNYLERPQTQFQSESAVHYPYFYAAPSNTGVISEVDVNGDGSISLPSDAFGFGFFPGQFAFVIYSKYPIMRDLIRSFQRFLWKDMPENLIPKSVLSEEVIDVFRLSSKNHVDVPIQLPSGHVVHMLASHPTPPVFDSDADENGRRNADEIRFLYDYITPGREGYIYDDNDRAGGLEVDSSFFICGDLNSDPYDGDSRREAISTLLSRYNVIDPLPSSPGGAKSFNNLDSDVGDPRFDTSFFNPSVGNLRVDYVIPSSNLNIRKAQVFWPDDEDELFPLVNASDHRAVFVDVILRANKGPQLKMKKKRKL